MRTHVEFRSDKFPSYPGVEEGPNPDRGGKRLAEYLQKLLPEHGVPTREIHPEDWGWMIPLQDRPFSMWLGCGRCDEFPDGFLVFIEPSKASIRPFPFFKSIAATPDIERVANALDRILRADPDIHDVRWREDE